MIRLAKAIEAKLKPADAEKVREIITSQLPKFTKTQLAKSQKYLHRHDALNALLNDNEQYSFAQVDEIFKKFNEGVKE